jgi:hypothetical protein
LQSLISNHFSLHEEYEEKPQVALILLRELRFFVVGRKSTYYIRSAELRLFKYFCEIFHSGKITVQPARIG